MQLNRSGLDVQWLGDNCAVTGLCLQVRKTDSDIRILPQYPITPQRLDLLRNVFVVMNLRNVYAF